MEVIWTTFLYRPLLNFLILLYNTIGFQNLGLAVVWLTVFVRLALLPLSIIVERNKSIFGALSERIERLQKELEKDQVLMRQTIRDLLRKNRVYPWANVMLLLIQLLVLVLLYQVFIGGIHFAPEDLYQFISRPENIDTTFVGLFDISQRNFIISAIVAVLLFFNIRIEQGGKQYLLTRKNAFFLYLFPAFTFVALAVLPSVKALFILTSMLLSVVIHFIQQPIYRVIFREELSLLARGPGKPAVSPVKALEYIGNPWDELRRQAEK